MIYSEKEFDYIKIKLASPTRIKEWGQRILPNGQIIGEVQKSETINYRTFKPEMDGLFCERIFGPNKNLECACGKYKRVRYEGLICDRCGVELTESRVRRHRMGHINLIYPVTHIWYINSRPNYMALLLEVEQCEKKIDTGVPLKQKITNITKPLKSSQVNLNDERIQRIKLASLAYFIADDEITFYGLHWDFQMYRRSRRLGFTGYPKKPEPKPKKYLPYYNTPKYLIRTTPNYLIGSMLIKKELEKLNINSEVFDTRNFITYCSRVLEKDENVYLSSQWFRKWEKYRIYKLRDQAIKRLRILENILATGANPSWMILSILPVIPPALRPMIQLEGGRFATSDLNELYRRVITRNNRLLRLLEIDAPQLIIRNEKRMLQEAIDTLIDNGKRGKIALSANNRPLKSLSDIIKGKHGRFRQNLLGKRVDYSGRSVIVVGPNLKMNQCGLPYEMAIELFQPFIIRELINQGLASNMKVAKTLIQQSESLIIPVLKEVLLNHPIFLNRAPTLHRLGIQAFEPILVHGRAIRLHPLVCSAFNADFDGDQMAVHIPLSSEAQAECYMLMLAPYNFLSPSNGEPIVMPSQDMVLGSYYLTVNNIKNLLGSNHYFSNLEDVILAYNQQKIELHSIIWVRYKKDLNSPIHLIKKIQLKDQSTIEYYDNLQIRKDKKNQTIVQYLKTTTGRVIFNFTIQKSLNLL
uniref:DNA-directed RNA polymerase subunit beta' n=1 Tax=Coscinodiscus radiatus TaxID=33642 RepID=A0A023HBL4_9STRA|nr:RNA polymerase b'-subunit [Coscinodiscus radiatus]AGH28443.1 RNA polymerase b'-subunit [Coscinodiscus radiatus]